MKREINMIKKKIKKEQGSEPISFAADGRINTDPNGMWTGVSTENEYEKPIQDVDDL